MLSIIHTHAYAFAGKASAVESFDIVVTSRMEEKVEEGVEVQQNDNITNEIGIDDVLFDVTPPTIICPDFPGQVTDPHSGDIIGKLTTLISLNNPNKL